MSVGTDGKIYLKLIPRGKAPKKITREHYIRDAGFNKFHISLSWLWPYTRKFSSGEFLTQY